MAKKDYYAVLGIDKNASDDDIKSAYRKMAKQYHPDLHPNDAACAEKFKECNEAYSVLGDKDKRARYDRGEMDFDGSNPFAGQGASGFSAGGFDDIFDIFSNFMGGGGTRSQRSSTPTGSDISYSVELTFMEAALGCKKSISFARIEKCATCGGTGAKDNASMATCDKCKGTGRLRYQQQTLFGTQITEGVCDRCGGSGKIVTNPCRDCAGKGVVTKKKVITVTIPSGVENGSVMQIPGEGNASKSYGGRNGNLLLVIQVAKSKVFSRDGADIYTEIPVPYSVATCGGDIEVPTLDRMQLQHLPEGTSNGETFRFRGKGIKTSRGTGDLYVKIAVEVPQGLSRTQKTLLDQYEKEMTQRNYPKRKAYLDELGKIYK